MGKYKLNISKQFILKISCFIFIISAAYLFDNFYKGHNFNKDNTEKIPESENIFTGSDFYFYNPVKILDFKSCSFSFLEKQFFQEDHDKYLQRYHNYKINSQFKNVIEYSRRSISPSLTQNLLFINHYFNPDDIPIIS